MSLAEALGAWLEHRKDVLVRRSQHRLDQIAHRLEVLDGYIIAYLNLDEVIRIIREEDDAKAVADGAPSSLTDVQAEAILNMRLRSLRKLEEIELRTEHKTLTDEKAHLEALLGFRQAAVGRDHHADRRAARRPTDPDTPLGTRRTDFRRRARRRRRRVSTRADRARADHRHPLRKGLDPRDQGPHRRDRREGLQDRRPAEARAHMPRPPTSCCC